MPGACRRWLEAAVAPLEDPLAPVWVVVSSAAMRQRLDWDLAAAGQGDGAISSNVRYFFPEEFIATIETMALAEDKKVRHDWSPEAIALRLLQLPGGAEKWSRAMADAQTLDECIRWRPDLLETTTFSPLVVRLLASPEWQEHGPLVQRTRTLKVLRDGRVPLAPVILFYGLQSAPGGASFVSFVQTVASQAATGFFSVFPKSSQVTAGTLPTATLSWWRALDAHRALWEEAGVPVVVEPATTVVATTGLRARCSGVSAASAGEVSGVLDVIVTVGVGRQAEVARDWILQRLEAGAQPHEILVTGPDIDRFLPHLERHWHHGPFEADVDGYPLPRVPFEVVERGAGRGRNRVALLSRLLTLVNGHASVDQVADLLLFPSLCAAIGLDESTTGRIATLARDAHVAFGIDGSHQERLCLPGNSANVGTWSRLLERLAYAAMEPDGAGDVSDDSIGTENDLELLAPLGGLFALLERAAVVVDDTKSLTEWLDWLRTHFASVTARKASKDDSIERAMRRLADIVPPDQPPALLSFATFRDVWFAITTAGTRVSTFGRGGVHVTPLPTVAGSAYRHVVVLGLDDENFPGASLASAIMQPPRVGDPNPRNAVMGALLLAVTSASDAVLVTCNGRTEHTGEPPKATAVREELLEMVGPLTVREAARHGYARPADRDFVDFSFDPRYRTTTDAEPTPKSSPVVVGEGGQPFLDITVKELQRFLEDAASHYLSQGLLGVSVDRIESDETPPRVSLGTLQAFTTTEELIHRLLLVDHPTAADLERKLEDLLLLESVAGDIPSVLLSGQLKPTEILNTVTGLRFDLEGYRPNPLDALGGSSATSEAPDVPSTDDLNHFYDAIVIEGVGVVRPRSGQKDERDPWTVYRDYSQRSGTTGAPARWYRYHKEDEGVVRYRKTLAMLVDIVVMRCNQKDDDPTYPVATLYTAATTENLAENARTGFNSYEYRGTKDEAKAHLRALVELFARGRHEHLCIGRYVTADFLHSGDKHTKALEKDREDPTNELMLPHRYADWAARFAEQGLDRIFRDIATKVKHLRKTPSKRSSEQPQGPPQFTDWKYLALDREPSAVTPEEGED
jgi:Exodeoxyribonuclease V, gamma subunit